MGCLTGATADGGHGAASRGGWGPATRPAIAFRHFAYRGDGDNGPAAGAAGLTVLTIRAFADTGVVTPAPAILAAAVLGLALAQTRSRTTTG